MDLDAKALIALLGLVLGLVAGLLRHAATDAATRQELRDLKARVRKIDGINGHG